MSEEMFGNKEDNIRKGPWKVEEDEVLINHVKKYGPRDWSSIRSKGLLQRTGKSCRLRWVNKLRPNLKNGCKFSPEEERVVIELQAQFGNKWARIATYLPGRTDNDVKNFWSSRQKRLARILQTSSAPPKSHKNKKMVHARNQGQIFSSSSEGESLSKVQSCKSSFTDNSEMKMVSLPDLVNTKLLNFEQDLGQPYVDSQPLDHLNPFPPMLQSQSDLTFPSEESQDFLARPADHPYFDVFGLNGAELPLCISPFPEPVVDKPKFDEYSSSTPDGFFDDFPVDMFDQIESHPSPPPPESLPSPPPPET